MASSPLKHLLRRAAPAADAAGPRLARAAAATGVRIAFAALAWALSSLVPARAEFSVGGRLERDLVREDERAVLELEIVWGEADLVTAVSEPSAPELDGLMLVGRSVAERSEITAEGIPLHHRIYRYELRPTRRGAARIGAAEVTFSFASGEQRRLNSAPLALQVSAAAQSNLLPAWLSLGALMLAAVGLYVWWIHRRPVVAPAPDPLRAELEQALQAAQRGDCSGAGERMYGLISEQLKKLSGQPAGSDPVENLNSCGLEEPLKSGLRETLETLRAARYGRQPAESAALELAARRAAELLDRSRRETENHG